MAAYEIIINTGRCKGCDYCVEFCSNGCISRPGGDAGALGDKSSKFGSGFGSGLGYMIPVVTHPEQCTGCGTCTWMCPHWAIEVNRCSDGQDKSVVKERVAGPPRLAVEPPFAGCAGCQHPTVGRIIAEVLDEMGIEDRVVALESIPCSISSVFGVDFGRKLAYDENATDVAAVVKHDTPDAVVFVVQGYWGLADFSFNIESLIGALIRGENYTMILCNMPFYGPKEGRPVPVGEPVEGRLEPATRINTPEGQEIIIGGKPLHIAELAATFKGTAYSARGDISSLKDYQLTKSYIRTAFQKQIDKAGFSFVEVNLTCTDTTYSAPIDCLSWIKENMSAEFPLGEFKNV